MAVLLQFNTDDNFSLLQLHETTQIKMDILTQVVQILLKSKLLKSVDDENDLKSTSEVSLNLTYKKYVEIRLCRC